MNSRPVKIKNALGDLQRFTAPEEDFIAYRASLQLANDDSSNVAQIGTFSGTNIGSFTDTFFNEAVGTHPGSALSTGSSVTTLYQITGTDLDSADANFRTPINVNNVAGKIAEFSQAEWGDLSNRLAKIIMTNEYPGTFRLGSSAPSGDYSVHLNNVFSDTQTDGTTVNYSIYKRTTMTAPTKVNAMAIKRSAGPTGTYQGVQAMDSDQMTYSFGNHLKTWIMSTANNVGAYQLRSSAQGAPVATGTWSARGTATDTKKTTSDVDYTRNSTNPVDKNFTSVYETDYSGDYVGDFTGNYIGDFVGDFEGNFTGQYIGNYEGQYTRNSTRDSTRNSTTNSTRDSTRNSTTDFIRNSTAVYTNPDAAGPYAGNYIAPNAGPNYLGNFTGINYVGDYAFGPFPTNYFEEEPLFPSTINYQGDYAGNYVGDYIADIAYEGNYAGPISYTGDFTGNFVGDFTGNYIGDFTGNYIGDYIGDFTGNFIGDFTGNYDGTYTRAQDESFVTNYTRNSTADSTRNSTTNFAGNYVGTFTGDFVGTYTGDFTGNYFGETIQSSSETIETYTLYVRVA